MKPNQLFLRLTKGVHFLLKEHRGEVKLHKDVKCLAFFPVYVFICLPFLVFALYLGFVGERYPIIPGGRIGGGGTARYVEMADHPLLFFCVWGGSVLVVATLTVVLAIKSFKGLKRILESKQGRGELVNPDDQEKGN